MRTTKRKAQKEFLGFIASLLDDQLRAVAYGNNGIGLIDNMKLIIDALEQAQDRFWNVQALKAIEEEVRGDLRDLDI